MSDYQQAPQPPPPAQGVAYPAYPPPPQGAYPPPGAYPPQGAYPPPGFPMQGAQPIPGLPILPPRVSPQPGQIIVSYEVTEPEVGCCQCGDLNTNGILALIILVLVFWPLAFLPCIMAECHQRSQRPVYGNPAQYAAPVHYPGQPGPSQPSQHKEV